jgi:secondary thiamine-phosphate synthase enzyme
MDKMRRDAYYLYTMLGSSSVACSPPAPLAGQVLCSRLLTVATRQPIELIDITDAVAGLVRQAALHSGQVVLLSRHTTAAVRIQENEPLLLEDLREFLAGLAPSIHAYRHNDFRVRTHHMHPDERPNGHAHCLQLLLGSSESVPIVDGELALGTWQRLFLVELDGPRPAREVLVQLSGQPAVSSTDQSAALFAPARHRGPRLVALP